MINKSRHPVYLEMGSGMEHWRKPGTKEVFRNNSRAPEFYLNKSQINR